MCYDQNEWTSSCTLIQKGVKKESTGNEKITFKGEKKVRLIRAYVDLLHFFNRVRRQSKAIRRKEMFARAPCERSLTTKKKGRFVIGGEKGEAPGTKDRDLLAGFPSINVRGKEGGLERMPETGGESCWVRC